MLAPTIVIPAKAGNQEQNINAVYVALDSRLRGNDNTCWDC